MPGDAAPNSGASALRNDTIFLRLVEQTEDCAVNVPLGDLLSKLPGLATPSPLEFYNRGGYTNITGGYCIGRRANKNDSPNLPSALSSRVLSRTHAKVFVDPKGALWLMDLKSLHGTAVGRGIRNVTLDAYSPFRLEEGDMLILGKNVATRDGVTHLPVCVRVHYTFAPPIKSAIAYLPVPKFAECLTDITLPPRWPMRGWGIPVMYESEQEEDFPKDDLSHDETLNDDGTDSIVCMGSSTPTKTVNPQYDDDADSVVFTGSSPNSSQTQNALPESKATQTTFSSPITRRDVYSPQEAAAIRESILAIPLSEDEMGADDSSEHSYGDDRESDHPHDADDGVSDHSHDEEDGVSDDEHLHKDYFDDEAAEDGSDEGSISEEERMSDDELPGYGDDISEDYDYSDGDLSDCDDEDLSDRADDAEHEGDYDTDACLHSRLASDDEDDDLDEEPMPFGSLFLRRTVVDLIPSSMPEEEDFTQSVQGAAALVDEAVNQMKSIDAKVEIGGKTEVERLEAHDATKVDEPPLNTEEDDTEVFVAPSEAAATYSASESGSSAHHDRAHSPSYSPSSHSGSRESSPISCPLLPLPYIALPPLPHMTLPPLPRMTLALPPHHPAVGLGLTRPSTDPSASPSPGSSPPYSPRAPATSLPESPSHISESEEEVDAEDTWDDSQRLNVPTLIMVPDEIEEPRFAETESETAMETAPSEVIYSIPPSPPDSTGTPDAERVQFKMETVTSTVPPTPPSPAFKTLAAEAPTSAASSSTQSAATMDAGADTTAMTPRKRKRSALEEEAPDAPCPLAIPTTTPARPTRRRRIGTFAKGVALGVGIGVVSTFGALYQLGAE